MFTVLLCDINTIIIECTDWPYQSHPIFSERELKFTFVICCCPSVRLSVVCLLVTLVRPTHPGKKFSAMFLHYLVPWPSIYIHGKFLLRSSQENPQSVEFNTRWVAKYSDFGPIEGYVSKTVQDMR